MIIIPRFAKVTFVSFAGLTMLIVTCCLNGQTKTYKHAAQYQVAVLDQTLRVSTGSDLTLASNTTDAKLGPGGQGIHMLHTDAGDYRVEAPVNKGMSFLSAMGSDAYHPAQTIHNKWFLDGVQPGTKVLFDSECAQPNKKHPNNAVRCTFWFPDPDSTTHEYETNGDFTPYMSGDGSNTQKTANTLCGTGKLNPATEAQLCSPVTPAAPSPAVIHGLIGIHVDANLNVIVVDQYGPASLAGISVGDRLCLIKASCPIIKLFAQKMYCVV